MLMDNPINMILATGCLILYLVGVLLGVANGKWVEGQINTKENWAFLARFCFLSLDGQFEYLIEFERDAGTPNLLLYYDDDSQWPAVYHSSKTCREREAVLNRAGQNQVVRLSHWYPDTEYSGCVLTRANKELPASKSSTTRTPTFTTTSTPTTTTKPIKAKNTTKSDLPSDQSYYDQFLKTTTPRPKTPNTNSTVWFELLPTDSLNVTDEPEDEFWENIAPNNGSKLENIKDVELMFDSANNSKRKIKRSTSELYERFRRRRLNADGGGAGAGERTERYVVTCRNSRRFRSARERWWFIAVSNCDSPKGLEIKYKFLMTNGPRGDFWHEHFSADEFYVLPILIAYTFAYVIVMVAVVMCSVELKSRHLLHSTYKLFLISIVTQHCGVMLQSLAWIRYATYGIEHIPAKVTGQFFCGISETTFILLLLLMAKGYTITRGRLKVSFTVKLTIFMCCYILTYVILFIYQAKGFDPGEVLYLYESLAGYGLIVLRVGAWCAFAYATFFTVKKFPQKNTFYCPFFICGTMWFYAGPLFILIANSYVDKWVRESVVTAVLLLITFCGHIMFLLLTLPVFANKNFPYHVRTTQIGVMEVIGGSNIDTFGPNAYHPGGGAAQTVIIPLTRRTEELIGNIYSQYMATAPPLSIGHGTPKLNGVPKRIDSITGNGVVKQDSTDTNTSDDINPSITDKKEIFTVENQIKSIQNGDVKNGPVKNGLMLPDEKTTNGFENVNDLPNVMRSRRNILEPISVPSWSLAKGPCVVAMQKKTSEEGKDTSEASITKRPSLTRRPSVNSTDMGTIHEGHEKTYKSPVDIFTVTTR
ncbi:transmembrane protein 145-like [Aricia agestis]|uniref:transmembrane protein 145-like n=1 Tax=Aricia agestis TaxID=91739 RepID=UPI001C205BC7|nr:transmembrane protein 145-like [Aricia agestis]